MTHKEIVKKIINRNGNCHFFNPCRSDCPLSVYCFDENGFYGKDNAIRLEFAEQYME